MRNGAAWNKDDEEKFTKFPCLVGHPVYLLN